MILADWPNQKCKPYIVPFAGFINKPPQSSTTQFTEENFTYCSQNILKELMGKMLSPIHELIQSVAAIFIDIETAIQSIRIALANLRTQLTSIFQSILAAIGVVLVPLQQIFIAFKDVMGKLSGILAAVLYILMGVFDTCQAAIQVFIDSTVVILIIFAAIIMSLFAGTFTIPIALAGLVVFVSIAIPFGLLVAFIEDDLGIYPFKSIPATPSIPHFCFEQNVIINGKKVRDYKVGEMINGGEVTAKLKLLLQNGTTFFSPKQNPQLVKVTGHHRVNYKGQWIFAKDHPDFYPSLSITHPTLVYCFNTKTKTISIPPYIFLDWDEFEMEDNSTYEDAIGLPPNALLCNGKTVADTILGECIGCKECVLGIVYLKNNHRSFITSSSTITLFNNTIIPHYSYFAECYQQKNIYKI